MSTPSGSGSQTLSRGLRILEELADAREPLTIDQLAARLAVHRSVAYRLLRTLEDHGLVVRDSSGRVQLGARMAALAAGVAHDLQAAALPELTAVANDLGMTSFLAILDHSECVTLASVEPRHADGSVAQRPGTRHAVTRGAPGRAVLSLIPDTARPPGVSDELAQEVERVRTVGWATSHDEVIPSLRSVAVPLQIRGREPAAVAVVYVASRYPDAIIAEHLVRAASAIRESLGG